MTDFGALFGFYCRDCFDKTTVRINILKTTLKSETRVEAKN